MGLSVQSPFSSPTRLCRPALCAQFSGTGQCPGGQLAPRVCLNDLLENLEGAGTKAVLGSASVCDRVCDPKADLTLSSKSRQKQSLAGGRCYALPSPGSPGWVVRGGVEVPVCDPCSCCGDSCSSLAAWPNETLFP